MYGPAITTIRLMFSVCIFVIKTPYISLCLYDGLCEWMLVYVDLSVSVFCLSINLPPCACMCVCVSAIISTTGKKVDGWDCPIQGVVSRSNDHLHLLFVASLMFILLLSLSPSLSSLRAGYLDILGVVVIIEIAQLCLLPGGTIIYTHCSGLWSSPLPLSSSFLPPFPPPLSFFFYLVRPTSPLPLAGCRWC